MNWLTKIEKALEVAFKYELHAFVLLLTGVGMAFHGLKDEGALVLGAGLTVFKNKVSGGQ